MSRPSRTNTRSTRATFSGSSSCSAERGARSASARAASANASPSRCSVPSSPRTTSPASTSRCTARAGRPRGEPGVGLHAVERGRARAPAPRRLAGGRRRRAGRPARGRRTASPSRAIASRNIWNALDLSGHRAGAGRDRPSRRRRLRLRGHRSPGSPTPASRSPTASSPTATPAAPRPGCPASEMAPQAPRGADRGRGRRRRARPALPRLSRRPGRVDARPAPRHLPRDPPGAARPGAHAVARPQLGPHLREPSRSSRGRRGDDRRRVSRRAQPLGAPGARGRGLRAVDGRRRCGWAPAARGRRTTSTSPTRSTARSRRCCATRASCPTRRRPAQMVRGWTSAIAQAAGLPEGRVAEAVRVVGTRLTQRASMTQADVDAPARDAHRRGDQARGRDPARRRAGCPRARCSRTSCCTSRTRTSSRAGSRAIRSSGACAWSSCPARAWTLHEVVVSVTTGVIVDWQRSRRHAPDVADAPRRSARSYTTKEHPDYLAALAKRGITEPRRRADRPVAGRRVRLRLRGRPPDHALHLVPARPTRPTTGTRARSKASSSTSTWPQRGDRGHRPRRHAAAAEPGELLRRGPAADARRT